MSASPVACHDLFRVHLMSFEEGATSGAMGSFSFQYNGGRTLHFGYLAVVSRKFACRVVEMGGSGQHLHYIADFML